MILCTKSLQLRGCPFSVPPSFLYYVGTQSKPQMFLISVKGDVLFIYLFVFLITLALDA